VAQALLRLDDAPYPPKQNTPEILRGFKQDSNSISMLCSSSPLTKDAGRGRGNVLAKDKLKNTSVTRPSSRSLSM
jgi:hypothetical protein